MIPIRRTWIKIYDENVKRYVEESAYSSKHS